VYIAASTRCLGDTDFTQACHLLADFQFDRLELWFDEQSNHLKPSEVLADVEAFVANYHEITRLTPVAICLEHSLEIDEYEQLTRLAKLLRGAQITIPASPLGTPFNEEIERLTTLLAMSSEHGIQLAIRTRTGDLTEDPHTAVELCQAVGGLGLGLDPSYYICGPNKGVSFDIVYPYVLHVFVRDTTSDEFQVPVGLGEVEYSQIISQLKRENYQRSMSVEFFPELMKGLDRAVELRKLRMLLETLL